MNNCLTCDKLINDLCRLKRYANRGPDACKGKSYKAITNNNIIKDNMIKLKIHLASGHQTSSKKFRIELVPQPKKGYGFKTSRYTKDAKKFNKFLINHVASGFYRALIKEMRERYS